MARTRRAHHFFNAKQAWPLRATLSHACLAAAWVANGPAWSLVIAPALTR